jgi:tRNA(Ile2) C34 agmatinyltransferase TiaS
MKRCPICNSSRTNIYGKRFYCKKCGYTNKETEKQGKLIIKNIKEIKGMEKEEK